MYWWDGHMTGWGWVPMVLGAAAFWAVLITGAALLAYYLVRVSRRLDDATGPPHSALEVLAQRYARGEIDDEEYRRRVETLEARVGEATPRTER